MRSPVPTARDEWRKYWTLPIAAALGNIAAIMHIYSLGAFIAPLQTEFGWTRAQISSGISVSNGSTALLGIFVGWLIDRWGPRRVGLIGATLTAIAFSLLSTATGTYGNWLLLWLLIAIAASFTQPAVWTSAVSSRFDKSRGLAIATAICGAGAGATLLPILATLAIEGFGWRQAFMMIAGGWFLITFPMLLLFFRGRADKPRRGSRETLLAGDASAVLTGMSAKESFTSPSFYRLGVAGMLFAFCAMAAIVHFVPILTDRDIGAVEAASIAGLIGIASIAGRLGAGMLLDRFRPERVALFAFALPSVSAALLLMGSGDLVAALAAIVLGLSLGAEVDVIAYLTTRHFGLRRFGIIFATMMMFMTAGTAIGPVTAGAIFDHFGSYRLFLAMIIPMVLVAALLVGTMGAAPDHGPPPPETP